MEQGIEKVELGFWEWCGKIAEKLTFIRLKVNDHKDISEDDYDLLRVLHKTHYNGEYPVFQSKMEGEQTIVMQNSLFDDNTADVIVEVTDGTEVDTIDSEPKTE